MPNDSPIWFTLPDCFTPLKFEEDAEQRMNRIMHSMQTVLPQSSIEDRLRYALIQENALKHMWDQGVRYGATCLLKSGEDDNPRLTAAQFTASVMVADLTGSDSLSALKKSLRMTGRKRDIAIDELPVGQALLVAEENQLTLPAELSTNQKESMRTTRQVQAFIPLPEGNRAAVLALATEALEDWDEYLVLMRKILSTVSFRKPGLRSSIEDRLGGLL